MNKIQDTISDVRTHAKMMAERTKDAQPYPVYQEKDVDCPMCLGLRFLRRELPVGHPEFGKLIPCDCSKYMMYSQISGLSQYECFNMKWGSIRTDGNISSAIAAIRRRISLGYGWLYLWGEVGVGKTLLIKTAVSEMVQSGKMASYANMSAIIEDMRRAYDAADPSTEAERRLDKWAQIDFLVIDEFDRVRSTEFAEERKFLLMDTRYQLALMQRSVTIMASNEPPSTFDSYLRDRIEDGRFEVLHISGKSARPSMGWNK